MSGSSTDNSQRARLRDAIRSIRHLQKRVAELEGAAHEPIAIVGIGCRLPGDVTSPEAYWRLLEDGVDAITEVPPERWDGAAHFDLDPETPGKMYTLAGGFVHGLDRFDADLFGLSPREVAKIDPQHRLVLEVAWEALEHAGVPPKGLAESSTGVYLGITGFDYGLHLSHIGPDVIDAYSMTGTKLNFAAGRLSYVLGLQGPALAVDTACSSSLVAIHLACQALRHGECEMAVAGGVNAMLTPEQTVAECKARMLSPDGRCKTFDASADGFVRGEGCGMLVLERLSTARRHGRSIIAVIRGSAVNQDGPTSGPTVPNRLAQEAVIRRALQDAGLTADDIDYVEAHGTGTPLGDPIEVRALANVFGGTDGRHAPLRIGSVKTNFGHLESASGVAGLMKTVLGLQHEAIPPHLHVKSLNPAVDWASIPIDVPTDGVPWPLSERTRRAGVSSFGASGTNAHIVVEEWRPDPVSEDHAQVAQPLHAYCLSAASKDSLVALATRHEQALADLRPTELGDACHTVAAGRSHFRHRLAVLGETVADIQQGLCNFADGNESPTVITASRLHAPRIALLFSSHLGDYIEPGRGFYESQAVFRERLDECAEILGRHFERPLTEVLFGEVVAERRRPVYAEPALVALQYALAGVWHSWGVSPSALLGYGSGEYAAACIAGALPLESALRLARARGQILEALAGQGSMLAVAAKATRVIELLDDHKGVSVAAVNGPENVVISGMADAIASVARDLDALEIRTHFIDAEFALQSALVEPLLDDFAAAAGDVGSTVPRTRLVSAVTGHVVTPDEPLGPDYWKRQLRDTIHFDTALGTLADEGVDTFLEVGPGAVLVSMARGALVGGTATWVNSLGSGEGSWQSIVRALGKLYACGAAIDWRNVFIGCAGTVLHLPTYAFDRKRHWIDAQTDAIPASSRAASGAVETGRPLLGRRLRTPLEATQFELLLSLDRQRWLADHKVFDRIVVPATAYLEMLRGAAGEAIGREVDIEDVFIQAPLIIDPDGGTIVQILVEKNGDSSRVRILTPVTETSEDVWTEHVSARTRPRTDAVVAAGDAHSIDIKAITERCSSEVDIDAHYQDMAETGVEFGPAFRTVERMRRGERESIGWVSEPAGPALGDESGYWLHPALLDGCLQVAREALPASLRADHEIALIPMRLASLEVWGAGSTGVVSHATLNASTDSRDTYELDLTIADSDGRRIADLRGLRLARVDRAALEPPVGKRTRGEIYELQWRPQPLAAAEATMSGRKWLLFEYTDPLLAHSGDALRASGEEVWSVAAGDQLRVSRDGSTVRVDEPADFRNLLEATVGTEGQQWIVAHAGGGPPALYLQSLLHVAQAMESAPAARLVVVTHRAQGTPALDGLAAAPMWGLGRVIQTEHPRLRTLLLDLEDEKQAPQELLAEAMAGDAENQVLYRSGERHVARLSLADDVLSAASKKEGTASRLVLETPGIPDSLALQPVQRRSPGTGEVEIEIAAAGLNFRDVLVVLGVYQGPAGPLGGECSGRIVAVGGDVTDFEVGDNVIAFASGTMASHVVTDARLTWAVPTGLSDEQAASLPITFLTAAYCLNYLGRMEKGDRVLIHGAAGGVGMAAVQLARRAGAEIFGTAGTPEKRELVTSLGVDHALDSRSLDFADEVMKLTNGEGIDLVLNSLAGEFIPASLRITKKGGRFIEIGRTDIWSNEKALEFKPGIEYQTVLLGDVCESDPELIQGIGREVFADVEAGNLAALPVQSWPMEHAADAFRLMARAGHTGKLVLTNDTSDTQAADKAPLVRGDAAYLVTGGFGGLGLEVARWLVSQGAGLVALMGRSEPGLHAQAVIGELRDAGASILEIFGDVTSEDDVRAALERIDEQGLETRGIVHAAGTLDDGVVAEQDWQRVESVLAPKMTGAWNLHNCTAELPLDLFVLFSSASALFGAAGQGGYAAGNAFLDALARWRRGQGLPALSINWGPWADVGMFVDAGDAGRRAVSERGFDMLPAKRNLAVMTSLLQIGMVEAGVFSVDWSRYFASRSQTAVPPLVSECVAAGLTQPETAADTGAFARELRAAPGARRRKLMQQMLREEAAAVLSSTANAILTNQGFRELGMDSLMSVELRNRLERLLACSLVSTLAFDHPNIEQLGDYLLSDVLDVTGDREIKAPTDSGAAVADDYDESIAELSDEEAEQLLMEELNKMREAEKHG